MTTVTRALHARSVRLASGAVHRLPGAALPTLARWIAPRRDVARHPGWSFNTDDEDQSLLAAVRRQVMHEYAAREINTPVVVPWAGRARLALHLGNDLSKCIYIGGEFEPNELAFLAEFLENGMTFIDVGANEGAYTVFAASRVGEAGRVIALEPSSREGAALSTNLELNDCQNTTLVAAAAGKHDGETHLAVAEARHAGQNTIGTVVANPKVARASVETVSLRTLDSLVADHGLRRVDFIKIDAEGSELGVLEGATETLRNFHPLVQLEMEPAALSAHGTEPADVELLLRGVQYELWEFDEATGRLRPRQAFTWGGNVIAAPGDWKPRGYVP